VFHHYRRPIELHRTEPAVVHGDFHMLLADHDQVYAFTRRHGTTELLVLASFSGEPATIEVPDADRWQGSVKKSISVPPCPPRPQALSL